MVLEFVVEEAHRELHHNNSETKNHHHHPCTMPLRHVLSRKRRNKEEEETKATDTSGIDKALSRGSSSNSKKRSFVGLWRNRRKGYRKEEWSLEDTASIEEEAQANEQDEDDFFNRFQITVVRTGNAPLQSETTSRANDSQETGETFASSQQQQQHGITHKRVRFHKYDHVLFPGGDTEYVYSLYDQEIEAEANHNFRDDIEGMVGGVSNLFRYIERSIHDAAGNNTTDDEEEDDTEGEDDDSKASESLSMSASESLSVSSV